ncbi:peptidyl-prolyl cis-trans isomerase FKBP16-1, chloroplastic isoform X3 [Ananas comosus]|uniref:peptidylprolyl isomerase n=1 Tax=Ananas comosus TaxID=4615 RepID=A0A6P5GL05_ANACO|nr:peptidyl-prolyl cis-trans isomerase FKBP16-1, chloroplastic isoform X3 [Ananas comosus]
MTMITAFALNRHVNKWNLKKLKIYCSGFSPEAFLKLSRRRLLSEFGALGAVISYTNPARSAPLQEAKDPDVIRYQKLSNGVKLQDILEGEGPAACEGDFVEVNYVCRRSNGYFVHSTVDQFTGESRPVVLPLDEKEIIRGLKDVLIGMKVGGKRRALIPPEFHPLINTVKEHSADSCVNKSNEVVRNHIWSSEEPTISRKRNVGF